MSELRREIITGCYWVDGLEVFIGEGGQVSNQNALALIDLYRRMVGHMCSLSVYAGPGRPGKPAVEAAIHHAGKAT